MLNVHSIETFGTNEGPGIRLVVFVQGCGFNCVYCHNPDTIEMKENKLMSADDILKLLEKGRTYYAQNGGLTVSGGEPSLQAAYLTEVFKLAKANGFNTSLDTNGFIFNEDVKRLWEQTDLVLLDVKHIDNDWHIKVTGKPNTQTLKTAEYLENIGKKMWLRYVLVPGLTDQEEFLEQWAKHFMNYKNIERVEILPYHTLGVYKYKELGLKYNLEGVKTPSAEVVQKAKSIFEKYLPMPVYVR